MARGRHLRPEHRLQAIASHQDRCLDIEQIAEAGVSRGVLRGLVGRGWLVPELHGVYRVGLEPLAREGRWSAALLAAGPRGALSHWSAAERHAWITAEATGPVHVTSPTHRRSVPGRLVVHRSPLAPGDVLRLDGHRVTSVSRTLLDLAACAPPAVVAHAVHEAEVQRRLRPAELAGAHGRRGAPLARRLAADRLPVEGDLRQRLERDFAAFRRARGYPSATTNAWLRMRDPDGWIRLDVLWREIGLAVELDGRAVHATQRNFDEDRRRDRRVKVQHGIDVVRATWRHVHDEADELDRDLRALMLGAGRDGSRNGSPRAIS